MILQAEEEKQILGQSSENANYLSTLKSVVGSKHYHQRYLSRNTVASAANLYSDIYAPTPRYSWFHHIHQSLPIQRLDGNAINGLQGRFRWHVVVHPPVPGAARWEREGLGYPAESDAIQALADVYFKTQNLWNLADQSNQFQVFKSMIYMYQTINEGYLFFAYLYFFFNFSLQRRILGNLLLQLLSLN